MQANVPQYILDIHLPVLGLNIEFGSLKKGFIFIQATTLCIIQEEYKRAAVEDRYQPYPSKLMKQNVPCDIASNSCSAELAQNPGECQALPTSIRINLCNKTFRRIFAIVMHAIMIKEPTMKP